MGASSRCLATYRLFPVALLFHHSKILMQNVRYSKKKKHYAITPVVFGKNSNLSDSSFCVNPDCCLASMIA